MFAKFPGGGGGGGRGRVIFGRQSISFGIRTYFCYFLNETLPIAFICVIIVFEYTGAIINQAKHWH